MSEDTAVDTPAADASPTELVIPTLQDIMGDAAPAAAPAPDAAPRTQRVGKREAAPAAEGPTVAQLRNDLMTLRAQLQQQTAAPQLSADDLGAAVAKAMQPKEKPAAFDPLAGLPADVRKEYEGFLGQGLAPALDATNKHFSSQLESAVAPLMKQVKELQEQLAKQTQTNGGVVQASLDTALRSTHPDWEEIRTSPEWSALMAKPDPLTGLPYSQVLQWRLNNDGVAAAVESYNAIMNIYRQNNGAPSRTATQRLSDVAQPKTMRAGAVGTGGMNIAEEVNATNAMIAQVRASPQKTQVEVDKLQKLYARLSALNAKSQSPA